MSQTNQVEQLSVRALFDSNTQYVIPIYQRNYAWGATEIEQLIQDISDAAGLMTQFGDITIAKQAKYYIGSLVVNNVQRIHTNLMWYTKPLTDSKGIPRFLFYWRISNIARYWKRMS
ncbi:DUF262 domain-containing protein [Vibrio parahaemolyticus]|uniref:DUF262 domain-containing protein n=1 Tax=Vibrio parahaemolyticus TaxID=670 RepID=UPI003260DAE2